MNEKDVYYIWFSRLKSQNKRKLLEQHGDIIKIYDFISYNEKAKELEAAHAISDKCIKLGINVVTYEEMAALKGINAIKDKPFVLYYKGNIIDKARAAAVVGARRCTKEGKTRTLSITADLVEKDVSIVSGMARGIDSYAHTKTLMMGGYTIAVLGCGLDICYPKEHDKLMEKIAENGLLLSEYPPGTPAYGFNFPKRNRLIAALADEIHVVEAGKKSGALITAEYGEKYGKRILFY